MIVLTERILDFLYGDFFVFPARRPPPKARNTPIQNDSRVGGRLPDAVTYPKGKSLSTGLAPTRKPVFRRRLLLPKSLADHADLFPPKAEKSANARRLYPQTGRQSDARVGLRAFSGSP